jgi:succinyl-CoA synthetase beta subunit
LFTASGIQALRRFSSFVFFPHRSIERKGLIVVIVSEDLAKRLLAPYGLQVPPGQVAQTPEAAARSAEKLGGTNFVVKALIPAGGRGKAGGVKMCATVKAVGEAAQVLLGQNLLGYKVDSVLVEKTMPIVREFYAGVVANPATNKIDLVFSLAGGMDIELSAQRSDQAVWQLHVEPGDVLPIHRVRQWLQHTKTDDIDFESLARVLVALYRASVDLDAILLEINPLAVLVDGLFALLDCKLEIDDNGLVRQPELVEVYKQTLSSGELRARELGVSYVPLDGDIGVITSGAGLGMCTLDLLKQHKLAPANFLDTGGGISESLVQGALELVMGSPQVRGAIINLYGGINRMLEASKGVVAALRTIPGNRPLVVKIMGNQQEEAWAMLESVPNVHVIRVVQTEVAVARLAELVG